MFAGALLPRSIDLPLDLSAEAERHVYEEVRAFNETPIVYNLTRGAKRSKHMQSLTILNLGIHQYASLHPVSQSMSNPRPLVIIPNITDIEFYQGSAVLLTVRDFKLLEFVTSFDCDHALTEVSCQPGCISKRSICCAQTVVLTQSNRLLERRIGP